VPAASRLAREGRFRGGSMIEGYMLKDVFSH
jgi:hypothetical protein